MAEARAVAIEAWTPRLLLLFAMAASLFWKLQALALPPHGEHAWRDADGLGVARAFLHESWNLLLPRAAERGSLPGIVGMELPLVNWLAGASMALFGESDAAARAPVWLSVAALALGGRALGRRRDSRLGRTERINVATRYPSSLSVSIRQDAPQAERAADRAASARLALSAVQLGDHRRPFPDGRPHPLH